MDLQRQVSRRLYQEHVTVLDLLARFGQALGRLRGETPAAGDPGWSVLLAQLGGALEHEVTRHFQHEEEAHRSTVGCLRPASGSRVPMKSAVPFSWKGE